MGRKPIKPTRAGRRAAGRGRSDSVELALAALAHEVRTPLNGILVLAELIAAADLPARERAWAAALKGAAEHLAQLTSLVVDGVRAGARGLVPQRESFRPAILAAQVAASLEARAAAKGLDAAVAIADDLPDAALGDVVRLRAALENLIDNAVKFTPHGAVRLAVAAEPAARRRTRLVFTVADAGIGMSKAEIARLFRPFAQASRRTGRRFGGAGLGLALVRRIARAMDGDLTVVSTPGKGSTFRLTAMVDRLSETGVAAEVPDAAGSARPARLAPLRILCAEDNPHGRLVLNAIGSALGHALDFVGDGAAAVEAVRRGPYDVVLMDLNLPGLDGLEAARRIRALPGTPGRVPIVGISGRGTAGRAAARAAGMNEYLVKPVTAAALAEAIRVLSAPRAE